MSLGEMTPKQFADYCKAVKSRIVSLISSEIVPVEIVPGEKVARIVARNVVDKNNKAWADRLKSERHKEIIQTDEEPKEDTIIHAVMVGYGGIEKVPAGSGGGERPVRTVSYKLRFTIDSYYQDVPGTDEDNAEDNHGDEIFRFSHKLLTTQPFGIQGVIRASGFRERRGFGTIGDVMVRESLGEIYLDIEPIGYPFRS